MSAVSKFKVIDSTGLVKRRVGSGKSVSSLLKFGRRPVAATWRARAKMEERGGASRVRACVLYISILPLGGAGKFERDEVILEKTAK